MLDASTNGALVDKTPVTAKILIANRALNALQYEGIGQRDPSRQHHINMLLKDPKGKEQVYVVCALCKDISMINALS
ncbi:hypothetical protein ACFX10_034348 [Malus domestica]